MENDSKINFLNDILNKMNIGWSYELSLSTSTVDFGLNYKIRLNRYSIEDDNGNVVMSLCKDMSSNDIKLAILQIKRDIWSETP